MPIAVAHGEGRVEFKQPQDLESLWNSQQVIAQFVDNYIQPTENYPANPNGSPQGITALSNKDGRIAIMMPHPERVFRTISNSWHPENWGEDGAWMRLFRNARVALK